ncbi:MAG: Amino acid adenylation, partial [Myxococcaceae bacterium]|nr:Amino acid adenylation [Myxococcaceae bacterium]
MQPDDFDPFAGSALTHTAPVTPEQEEIWLSIQLGGTPASLAYNQPIAFELRGALDVPALRHALDRLIERHEALRITLSPDGAALCVAEKIAMPFTEERLAPGDASDTRARAELACRRVTAEPFDLVLGPLVRAHLVTIGEQEHVLVIVSHHLVCDGWSLGVIGKELGQLYSAERTQKPAALDEAVPFSTYAAQRTGDEQVAAERTARAYWLSLFKELPAPLDLPLDGPRPAERTFAADRIDFTLPAKLVTDLKAVSTKSGVSIVVMLLGAFQVLLHRLTSQRAIAIAMPVAGQSVTGQHALVGHCVRALPVLAQIDPEMPFAQHLLSVRRSLLDAIEHSDVSFGGVIKDLGVPRDPSRVPLAPVMFNVDQDSTIPELAGLEVRVESPARASENFEIFVNARLLPKDEILLETMFKTDLFSRRTVELRLVEYRTLLESIVQNPSEKIGDLELMSVEEKQRV